MIFSFNGWNGEFLVFSFFVVRSCHCEVLEKLRQSVSIKEIATIVLLRCRLVATLSQCRFLNCKLLIYSYMHS